MMRKARNFVIGAVLACAVLGGALAALGAGQQSATAVVSYHDVDMGKVARIRVGVTTAEQVTELLGTPYRKTNYGDCNIVDYQEFWEYVGHDSNGIFKIHIEFDEAHIARIVAKDVKKGPMVVLAAAAKPEPQHRHEVEAKK